MKRRGLNNKFELIILDILVFNTYSKVILSIVDLQGYTLRKYSIILQEITTIIEK